MKHTFLILALLVTSITCTYAQKKDRKISGQSTALNFAAALTIKSAVLADDGKDGVLDAAENGSIKLSIKNTGNIPARNVLLRISLANDTIGIKTDSVHSVSDILANETKEVLIPLSAGKNLPSGDVVIHIKITDKSGAVYDPFELKLITKEFPKPFVFVEKAEFTSDNDFKRNNPIHLKLVVKNSGGYIAKDVKVGFDFLYKNCFTLSDTNKFDIGTLKKGESKVVEYIFTANSEYVLDNISLKTDLGESNGKYARDTTLSVKLLKETYLASKLRGSGDPLKGLNISRAKEVHRGDYFALIIGIDKYLGNWTPLDNAVRDAQAIENLLKTKYQFDYFRTLYNNQATRENIIKNMEWLIKNVTEDDNVFIYYSGHGDYKQQMNKGYWVPVNAKSAESTFEFISNSDIQTFLASIKSKHTLLVSDACFSGDIFRGTTVSVPFEDSEKYYGKVHDLISRQAMTSGGIEPVMDGGSDGHSVFAYYLLKMLNKNQNKYYDAGQLYNDIKIPVTNNSDQSPKLQPIKKTGDEGGQFIFIRK